MKLGLIAMDEDPKVALDVARAADKSGIHSIWSIDYYNRSCLARAASFAAATETAFIGTSIAPLFARAALATAAAVADIQVLSGGRFLFGVGTSTRRMNSDWYDVDLDHPAPRMAERINLVRDLIRHQQGPFRHEGRFDTITMAHYDRVVPVPEVPIYAAGVGPFMVNVAGRHADGFVGHPIASAHYLQNIARPALAEKVVDRGGDMKDYTITSQIIASVNDDPVKARKFAAIQVGFYATVKGYGALFPDGEFVEAREAARTAFRAGDLVGLEKAGHEMVEERAVFGTPDDVASQLRRYEGAVDIGLLYTPHIGIEPAEMTANEHALLEVTSCWTS